MALSFPTDVSVFDSDDRISFSRLDNKFIAVHDDGTEFEFDAEHRQWIPTDDALDEVPPGAEAPAMPALEESSRRRRRDEDGEAEPTASNSSRPKKKQKVPPPPKQNTAVYVTGLPHDATISEVHDVFSRKAGVIAEEIDSGNPRIKLYNDDEGKFKGDALIVFFKPQSVEMAIMLLDDTEFRFMSNGMRDGRMRVQAADSSYKKTQYDQEGEGKQGNGDANGSNGAQQPERRAPRKNQDRQKIIKKTQKLDAKLADWSDDEPYPDYEATTKWDKTVVLRHMFTLQELEEDPAALLDIKEDIRDECGKLGVVTNVVLYDQEEDGVVTVKFREAEAAKGCIQLMRGRRFDGRTVEADLATGQEKFKKGQAGQENDSD